MSAYYESSVKYLPLDKLTIPTNINGQNNVRRLKITTRFRKILIIVYSLKVMTALTQNKFKTLFYINYTVITSDIIDKLLLYFERI